jgi:competence protein ComEA
MMCSDCHGLATSIAEPHTRLEWQGLVELMRQRGAPGTDEDAAAVTGYLSRYFGRVNVNRASKEEMEQVLELSQSNAAAIVEYRTHHGRFQSLDDLRQVPGLDSRQLQEKKNRIVFTDG